MSPHSRNSESSGMSRPNWMVVVTASVWPTSGVVPRTNQLAGTLADMAFTVNALRGGSGNGTARGGIVDHRLARRMLINQVRLGRLRRDEVCDAHPELIRAARNVGTETSADCPICEESK